MIGKSEVLNEPSVCVPVVLRASGVLGQGVVIREGSTGNRCCASCWSSSADIGAAIGGGGLMVRRRADLNIGVSLLSPLSDEGVDVRSVVELLGVDIGRRGIWRQNWILPGSLRNGLG